MMMERRVEYLLNAALRAEKLGDLRTARALRRMADDFRPIDRAATLALIEVPHGS